MKRLLSLFLAACLLLACVMAFSSCGEPPTEGLEYTLLDDGTYSVSAGRRDFAAHIVIPAKYNGKAVTEISADAFSWCLSLKSIKIPNSVTTIDSGAFEGCTSLESIKIPNSVTAIGSGAFAGCRSLTKVTFKNLNGWKAGNNPMFPASELSDPYVAADYLTTTYSTQSWTRR